MPLKYVFIAELPFLAPIYKSLFALNKESGGVPVNSTLTRAPSTKSRIEAALVPMVAIYFPATWCHFAVSVINGLRQKVPETKGS